MLSGTKIKIAFRKVGGFMFIVHILALSVLISGIAWKFRLQFTEAIPIGCSVLVLVLYMLSFFGALPFSDFLAVGMLSAVFFFAVRMDKEERRAMAGYIRREFSHGGTWAALLMTVIVTVCVSQKAVSWWDDYNFWATDVKSLFYLDGFAGKYRNVAAEFGDYPPGTQMIKWWFAHFSPREFKEGLMFAGYYFMNLAFLFPMLKALKRRNVLLMTAGAAALWLFPTVAEVFWCDGCCADLTMALVYGNFLVSVADRDRHGRFFYYARQALFLSVLVLIKNTGVLWAAFGLLFDYGFHWISHRAESMGQAGKRADRKALLLVTVFPVLTEGSWLGFCLWNRRIAKLTGTAVQMATGGMNLPAYQEDMVKAFAEAFVAWPLHRWKTAALDITPLGMFCLLLLFVFLLGRFRILDKKQAWYIGGYLGVTGILFYAINLISHLTIFAVETQYLEPFGMVSSIERYGAPFVIGGLYLLAYLTMEKCSSKAGILLCMAFVFLTADYGSAWRALYSYRERTEGILAEREQVVDEAAEAFLETVGAGQKGNTGRVLYLRDSSDVSWVRNTYIAYEASPVSVMCGNMDASTVGEEDVARAVRDCHAEFLYVDGSARAGEAVFQALAGGGTFRFESVYRVQEGEEGMFLEPLIGE